MTERLDGYIRVSQVAGRSGDRFQSPTTQRESIQGWAQAHGVTIAHWHEDLDRSGGTMDRPGMNHALRRIEQGHTSGIVVARLDRFARTVIGGLTTIAALHDKGARVVSVAESIDPATPMGRAMLGLLLIMAEWQRDQANEHLANAQHRSASAGRFPGKPAYGYMRDIEGQTLINPDQAQVVQDIYTMRAAGKGWRTIADHLTRQDIPTATGGRWATSTLQGLVRSEAYLGVFIGPRGLRIENAWPALVPVDLWERANERKGIRDDARNYEDRLLAGMARCANCRHVLARTVNPHGFVSYACRTIGCRVRPSIGAHLLDTHATALLNERLQRARVQPRPADDREGQQLAAAAAAAIRELEAWRDDLQARQALGEHDYREGLLARARARDDAVTAEAQHKASGRLADVSTATGIDDVDQLPWTVRRELAEAAIHSVWVRKSAVRGEVAKRHVAQRVRLVWRDEPGLPELPARGAGTLAPLDW